jgi:hypothetical protein
MNTVVIARRATFILFSGAVAQLGEHLLCKQGVVGSIPSSSTSPFNNSTANMPPHDERCVQSRPYGVLERNAGLCDQVVSLTIEYGLIDKEMHEYV